MEKYETEKALINNFWDRATFPNLMLTRYLLGIRGNDIKKVTNAYQDLWNWAGNSNDRMKEIEHLELIELALGLISNERSRALEVGISTLKKELLDEIGKA